MSTDRFANTRHIINDNSLFDQLTTMTKAHAYDIVAKQRDELEAENKILKERVRYLENLIKEYTPKLIDNVNSMLNILK